MVCTDCKKAEATAKDDFGLDVCEGCLGESKETLNFFAGVFTFLKAQFEREKRV